MYVCVCMYMCMYVCVYVYMCAFCMYMYGYVCICVRMYVCNFSCLWTRFVQSPANVKMPLCMAVLVRV